MSPVSYRPHHRTTVRWGSNGLPSAPGTIDLVDTSDIFTGSSVRRYRPVPLLKVDKDRALYLLTRDAAGAPLLLRSLPDGATRPIPTLPAPGWLIVDYLPDESGGVFVAEISEYPRPGHRIRRLDGDGHEIWAGEAGHQPMTGAFDRMLGVRGGDLYIAEGGKGPAVVSLDGGTGRPRERFHIPLSGSGPFLGPGDDVYVGLSQPVALGGHRYVLARTKLGQAEHSIVEPEVQFLPDLVGSDEAGRIYVVTADSVVRVAPDGTSEGEIRAFGITVDGSTGEVAVCREAVETSTTLELTVERFAPTDTVTVTTFSIPLDELPKGNRCVRLFGRTPNRFWFHVGRGGDGEVLWEFDDDGAACGAIALDAVDADGFPSYELFNEIALPKESRSQFPNGAAIGPSGDVYVVLSNPDGISVVQFRASPRD